MSFTADIKSKILNYTFKGACCRRAFVHGILFAKGYVDGDNVCFNVERKEFAELPSSIIREIFSKEPTVSNLPTGGRCKRVSFSSKACAKYVLSVGSGKPFESRCGTCQSSFLKGIFFASGRMSDPPKSYCLEFSCGNNTNAVSDYLMSIGIEMKEIMRREERVIYTKYSPSIEDFFAVAELNDVAYLVMNTKIRKEFRNVANRSSNFVMINIGKAVEAARPLIENLTKLEDAGMLDKIPEDLLNTARLRLQYPELSINQLAIRAIPPISKSGIRHRLDRLLQLSHEIIIKYNL